MPELSTKPYLIRAIHEWCADCGHTPYLAVVVDERTVVPRAYVKNGEIVLNVSMSATNRLSIGNELIEFQARFGGAAHELSIPVENVTAIYARETGHGMAFDVPKPPAVGKEDRREERRPPKPVAVASVPRPAPTDAGTGGRTATESSVPPMPLPAPSSPLQAVETDVATPAGGAASADDTAPPVPAAGDPAAGGPTPGGPMAGGPMAEPGPLVQAEASPPGASGPEAIKTEPEGSPGPGDGTGRSRRGGRPKLTRIK